MRTLINVVLFVLVLSFGSVACGDSDSPTAPSSVSSTTMPDAPPSFGPSTPVRTMPASFDADNLRPDARGWNAYDFTASWDGRMLRLVLVEDDMPQMREASKPHRMRLITVGTCPVEPHHSLQACGDPIWQGSMRLAGRLELDPIPLASCDGWIVVNAAELSDDKYDGWRNAPCPTTDDDAVSSDGTGTGWPEYPPLPRPMADHSLPITVSDRTGDLDWTTWYPAFDRNYDGGSRLSTDVTSLSLSDQDPQGWIRVTFTLDSALDLAALAAAVTGTPRAVSANASLVFYSPAASPLEVASHTFDILQWNASRNVPAPETGVWIPAYRDDDGWVSTARARSFVRPVSGVTGSSFSFDIRPPAEIRGAPGYYDPARLEEGIWIPTLSFAVSIDAEDSVGDPTHNDRSRDIVRLPVPFTLPDLP